MSIVGTEIFREKDSAREPSFKVILTFLGLCLRYSKVCLWGYGEDDKVVELNRVVLFLLFITELEGALES